MNERWKALAKLCALLLLAAGLTSPVQAKVIQQNGNVFLQGNFLEVGIAPEGWFGPSISAPTAAPGGFHQTSPAGLGFVADFQQDGWSTGAPPYGGDYIVAGSPYEGFAVHWNAGGDEVFFCQGNDICGPHFTAISLTETSAGDVLSAVWVGEVQAENGQRLRVTHTMSFGRDDLFITVQTRLENIGSAPLHELEFLRGIDPDNDAAWPGGDFDTVNAVVYQPGEEGNPDKALLRAAGTIFPSVLLFLGTADERARASLDQDWMMNSASVLDSPDAGPRLGDDALALAWRLGSLEPGAAVDIAYFYAFGSDAQAEALLDSFAARQCTGAVMTLWGGTASLNGWTVNVPPAAVPEGACLELFARDPASGPAPAAGMKSLQHQIEVQVSAPDGSPIVNALTPIQVCYAYTESDLLSTRYTPFALFLGNAPKNGRSWTLYPTSASPAERKVCISISNFGLFEVFTPTALPSTGFPPNRTTVLAGQADDKAYTTSDDLWLEIPRLGLQAKIVGVPLSSNWDVSWLGERVGWLEGTAFPSRAGNAVLTGHVWDAFNRPGPFAALNTLWFGDQIILHAWGEEYVYEVRSMRQVPPNETAAMFKPAQESWLTLVTCRGWDEQSNQYRWRILVRAVLVEVR